MAELITQRIRRNAAELKLHGVAEDPDELIDRAETAQLDYREFLEPHLRIRGRGARRAPLPSPPEDGGLPHHKTLDEFDISFQPDLDPKRLAELRSLRFIKRKVGCLILGPPGVGKSHISVGLAMDAARARLPRSLQHPRRSRPRPTPRRRARQAQHQARPAATPTSARNRRSWLPAARSRRHQPLRHRQPPLHPRLDDRHVQQDRRRMGRHLRRRSTRRRNPRPPPPRRRDARDQRAELPTQRTPRRTQARQQRDGLNWPHRKRPQPTYRPTFSDGHPQQEAALAAVRSKNTYLAAQYQRLKPRIGHGRALGAVKHSMLIAYWHMFSTGETYRDLGGDYFQRRDPTRATKRLVSKLEALGHIVTLQPHPA